MIPADDPDVDYRDVVKRGYDACAARYDEARAVDPGSEISSLIDLLADGDSVLDIGCGTGVPIARKLSERFEVTGVDSSSEMLRRARLNVPSANFIHDDIMNVEFGPATFEAAVAFYSIFHIPREEHLELFRRIHTWLKPGGHLLCTVSRTSETGYTESDFFGTTMYWSNYGLADYLEMLTQAEFEVVQSSSTGHGYDDSAEQPSEDHPLVLARKAG